MRRNLWELNKDPNLQASDEEKAKYIKELEKSSERSLSAERTLSDADLIKGGAKYVADPGTSEHRLEITKEQREEVKMDEEIAAYITRRELEAMDEALRNIGNKIEKKDFEAIEQIWRRLSMAQNVLKDSE